jgi:hypothetical protein
LAGETIVKGAFIARMQEIAATLVAAALATPRRMMARIISGKNRCGPILLCYKAYVRQDDSGRRGRKERR